MAEKIGKVECKTIARITRNKVFFKYTFHFTSFENTIQRHDTMKHDKRITTCSRLVNNWDKKCEHTC